MSAFNIVGEGSRSSPSSTISTVSTPSTFSANATIGNSNVTLMWTIPSSVGTPLLGYTIKRTESGTGAVTSMNLPSTDTRFIDTTVVAGHDYTYEVTANNAVGSTSADQVTVHAIRTVVLSLAIVPFKNNISVSGAVIDMSGQGISGQKLTIYRSTSLTGTWTAVDQLTTSSIGQYSTLLTGSTGIVRLMVVLSDDGTHAAITIDRTISSLRLKNGDLASIMTNSTMSNLSLSDSENLITFTLEQTGTANVSIPKDSVSNPGLIGVSIDGKQGNYQITETGDQYVLSLSNVKAGQIVSLSIGQETTQDTVPILIEITMFLSACVGIVVLWRCKRK